MLTNVVNTPVDGVVLPIGVLFKLEMAIPPPSVREPPIDKLPEREALTPVILPTLMFA